MNKNITLATTAAFCVAAAIVAAQPADIDSQLFAFREKSGLPLLLAQAQAPGRPITTPTTQAPQTPVKDAVAPTAPPAPGRPNFPPRPANEPPLKNPGK